MTQPNSSNGQASRDPRETIGEWNELAYNSQTEAVHMCVLRTGAVLYYSGFRFAEGVQTETRLWYPQSELIKTPTTPADIFCAGHSFLPDGRLLSTGGTLEYRTAFPLPPAWLVRYIRPITSLILRLIPSFLLRKFEPELTGLPNMFIFDPETEQWDSAGNMEEGRWYPTNTTLPDGRVLILSGDDTGGGLGGGEKPKTNLRMEVYDAGKGLELVGVIPSMDQPHGSGQAHHQFPSLYPRMHVLPLGVSDRSAFPAGKAFCSGYGPETRMINLHTWEWTDVDRLEFGTRHDGCSVLLHLIPPDYAARVLTFGGSEGRLGDAKATDTAELISFGEVTPTWSYVASMSTKRLNASSVILPDGKILVAGGNSTGQFDDPVFEVDLFDPEDLSRSQVARTNVPRGYHCTAILLPDGRVLSSGTTPFGNHELRMEVYQPYYLFKGDRPQILSVPDNISYEEPFDVGYSHEEPIHSVALVRPGATTHAFDMDQRYMVLNFNPGEAGHLTVDAPRDEHVAPPGYYMVFLLSDDGVPSEARFVHLLVRQNSGA